MPAPSSRALPIESAHPAAASPTMSVVVCDDDPRVRSIVANLVGTRSGRVIAETDRSSDAISLIERFRPDVVVLDLALAQGSGMDVIEFLDSWPSITTRVILFTAFDDVVNSAWPWLTIVHKTEFERLERFLDESEYHTVRADRRSPTQRVPRPSTGARNAVGTDESDDFYGTLAEARPSDSLLKVSVDGLPVEEVTAAVRHTIRVEDRLIRRGSALIALLNSEDEQAPAAVSGRLGTSSSPPAAHIRIRSV